MLHLTVKLSRAYFIFLSLNNIDMHSLMIVYYGYVYSNLNYDVIFCGGSSVHCNNMFILQKKIVRALSSVDAGSSCRPCFKALKILPLPCIYVYLPVSKKLKICEM